MKSVSKLFLVMSMFILIFSGLASAASDTVNTFLHYEDFPTQTSLTITQGESVDILSVAYSHNGQFASEKLELVGTMTLFSESRGGIYVTTNTYTYSKSYTLNTNTLPSGNYQLKFTAINQIGEKESSYLTLTVLEKITTVPIVEIISPTNGQVLQDTSVLAKFTVNDDNLNYCIYKLNSQSSKLTPCSLVNINNLQIESIIGINTLTVNAIDKDGNTGTDTVTFTVEEPVMTVPIVTITSPEDGQNYNYVLDNFTFTVEDDNLQICWYKLNSGSSKIIPCETGITNLMEDVDFVWGTNTLTVNAKDMDENTGTDTITFYSDNNYEENPPIVNIIYPVEGMTYTSVTQFTFTVNDENLESCWYLINGAEDSITSCVLGFNTVLIDSTIEGANTLTVYANDTFNNIGSDTVNFIIDSTFVVDEPPIITVITPSYNGNYINDITFELTVNENATVVYSLDGAANVSMAELETLRFFSTELNPNLGDHEVTFCATDLGGNLACVTVPFEMVKKKKSSCTGTTRILDDENESNQFDNRPIYLGDDEPVRITITFGEKIFYGFVTFLIFLIGIVILLYLIETKRK